MAIHGSANEEAFRGMRLLSESAMDAIANDVRTKPLAEVGRHVMPLLHHIVAMDDRECRRCQHWVPYDLVEAHRGECLYHASANSKLRFRDLPNVVMFTPFDWGCKGWAERQTIDDAQQSS